VRYLHFIFRCNERKAKKLGQRACHTTGDVGRQDKCDRVSVHFFVCITFRLINLVIICYFVITFFYKYFRQNNN